MKADEELCGRPQGRGRGVDAGLDFFPVKPNSGCAQPIAMEIMARRRVERSLDQSARWWREVSPRTGVMEPWMCHLLLVIIGPAEVCRPRFTKRLRSAATNGECEAKHQARPRALNAGGRAWCWHTGGRRAAGFSACCCDFRIAPCMAEGNLSAAGDEKVREVPVLRPCDVNGLGRPGQDHRIGGWRRQQQRPRASSRKQKQTAAPRCK